MAELIYVAMAESLRTDSDASRFVLRKNDIVARWGGEEFLLLLRDCPLDEAVRLAEEVRQAIAGADIHLPQETIHITISAGVSQYVADEAANTFFIRADDALYRAKANGRNKVEASGVSPVLQDR